MGFKNDVDHKIASEVITDYQRAATWLPFREVDIKEVFSESELKELEAFRKEMQSATSDNEKTVKRAKNAEKYGKVIVKLFKLAKIVV